MPEFALIRSLVERIPTTGDDVELAVGDDGAVLALGPDERLVVVTDTLNEGVHFLAGADPFDLGHKSLAVNLSDLAAMGADPRWALLNLSLPSDDRSWVEKFAQGFAALARRSGVRLVGGDTCSGSLSVVVTALGVQAPGKALRRDGARAGDGVWVSGVLGDAALALRLRRDGTPFDESLAGALDRPEPRLALGKQLVGLASACIDLSDGLLADLGHIAEASGLGATVSLDRLPASPSLATLDEPTRAALQLGGGDDYELCFTVSDERQDEVRALSRALDLPLARVGHMTGEAGVRCIDGAGELVDPGRQGWEHFALAAELGGQSARPGAGPGRERHGEG